MHSKSRILHWKTRSENVDHGGRYNDLEIGLGGLKACGMDKAKRLAIEVGRRSTVTNNRLDMISASHPVTCL